MRAVAPALAILCLGEVCWGIWFVASHHWWYWGLMITAYLIQVPVALAGVGWSAAAIAIYRSDAPGAAP